MHENMFKPVLVWYVFFWYCSCIYNEESPDLQLTHEHPTLNKFKLQIQRGTCKTTCVLSKNLVVPYLVLE